MLKILVIDDDMDVCEIMKICLRDLGHEVVTFNNGPEGIQKCDESYDLVITDRRMLGMLGEEVIHKIKRLFPNIRAVLMTGDLNEAVRPTIIAAGAEEIWPKPLDLDRVKQFLENFYKGGEKENGKDKSY